MNTKKVRWQLERKLKYIKFAAMSAACQFDIDSVVTLVKMKKKRAKNFCSPILLSFSEEKIDFFSELIEV